MALYEHLAELHWKHAVILKKRQIASSYFHMGKLINTYWFEEGRICKIGASLKDYIRVSVSNSFGFGGTNASLVFASLDFKAQKI